MRVPRSPRGVTCHYLMPIELIVCGFAISRVQTMVLVMPKSGISNLVRFDWRVSTQFLSD